MRGEAERVARLLGAWRTDQPVRTALRDALAELVDGAHLPPGWRMPGQRDLAEALGVARGTVARAYADLVADGRLAPRHGSGTYVRGARGAARPGEGRLTSFDGARPVVDLSSGALPGSDLVADVMPEVGRLLRDHLRGPGYHPAGLPELRQALAADFTRRGVPTREDEVVITAGSQQAVWLIATALTGPGTLTLVEDPSYRGALEAFAGAGGRVQGVRFTSAGLDLDLLARAGAGADLLYVQTALHNPTGVHTPGPRRRALGELAARHGLLVVDDQSQADLGWHRSQPLPGLDQHTDPAGLLTVGTLSKLFWGGIRVGWVRGPRELVGRLVEVRRAVDLGSPVADQLAALLLLPRAAEQQEHRRAFLLRQAADTEEVLRATLPHWRWQPPAGGSGLWIDTGGNAVRLSGRALERGLRLTPGPAFSPHHSHDRYVRLPVWLPHSTVLDVARTLAGLCAPREE
ncbi:PLP-dependent aminotransferase family protein [Streptomyces ardesiacus]|uniref:aminotransferase-like domain-containing protein n=2 Tax=Streptomyces ardesiacus TaxID=285564 RepID=UPI003404AD62